MFPPVPFLNLVLHAGPFVSRVPGVKEKNMWLIQGEFSRPEGKQVKRDNKLGEWPFPCAARLQHGAL